MRLPLQLLLLLFRVGFLTELPSGMMGLAPITSPLGRNRRSVSHGTISSPFRSSDSAIHETISPKNDLPSGVGIDDDEGSKLWRREDAHDGGITDINNNQKTSSSRLLLVKFFAAESGSTEALPSPTNMSSLEDFLASPSYRNLLFAKDAVITEINNPSRELLDEYRVRSQQCRLKSGIKDDEDDDNNNKRSSNNNNSSLRFVRLVNPPLTFLGLKLHSISIVGVQLIRTRRRRAQSSSRKDLLLPPLLVLPELQFTGLPPKFVATGPKALVWLFYKILGINKKQQQMRDAAITADAEGFTSSRLQTTGFVRVFAEPCTFSPTTSTPSTNDNKKDDSDKKTTPSTSIIFTNKAWLEGQMRIPPAFVKLLPISLDEMERRGSKTLRNAMQKDIGPIMERYQSAYLNWLSSSSSSDQNGGESEGA